jgi:hypothetical protein
MSYAKQMLESYRASAVDANVLPPPSMHSAIAPRLAPPTSMPT